MATERNFNAVPPVLLTANGSTEGVVQVSDTAGFYFGMQALLKNNSQSLTVYIKRVVSSTVLWVGPNKGGLDHNVDVSAYTTATNSTISAAEQAKATVPMEGRLLATYETDPVNAWRTIPVDSYGNHYDADNPVPVSFEGSISIGAVEVKGTNGNFIEPNVDGSLNVNVVSVPTAGNTVVNTYSEANSVPSSVITTLITYTVPLSKTSAILQRISVSGENIAKFTVFWNATQIDTRRTFYGSSLSEYFEFITGSSEGFVLQPGDQIVVKVLHTRPYVGDFEGRIQSLEIT